MIHHGKSFNKNDNKEQMSPRGVGQIIQEGRNNDMFPVIISFTWSEEITAQETQNYEAI